MKYFPKGNYGLWAEFKLVLIISILIFVSSTMAQSPAEIRNVDFLFRNDSLIVTYDIVKSSHGDLFKVEMVINKASGEMIRPKAVCGDIGESVKGGKGKEIIWDIRKDGVIINENIEVSVTAVVIEAPVKLFPRSAAIAISAVVPGLGITKLNRGGPYWIMAIGFYGAAAGSYLYYSSAQTNYNKYLDTHDESARNSLYDDVKNQNTISDVLMYTAGAIWVANIIWTCVTPNKTKPKSGLTIGAVYDPVVKQPLICLKYGF
ncbi:MAG: hypothetical protein WCJ95_12780 [Mariniphaga sp.]